MFIVLISVTNPSSQLWDKEIRGFLKWDTQPMIEVMWDHVTRFGTMQEAKDLAQNACQAWDTNPKGFKHHYQVIEVV